jgi:hypothetical protein
MPVGWHGLFCFLCFVSRVPPCFVAPQNLLLATIVATLRLFVWGCSHHLKIVLLRFRCPEFPLPTVRACKLNVLVIRLWTPCLSFG